MNAVLTDRPILLVEDNPVDLDLALRAFERNKLANPVLVARDGQEVLDWIPRWEAGELMPLVILLDVKLPRVNGLEVLRHLRDKPVSRCVPVVMLTSSSEDRDVQMAYQHRANSYIVKPVGFDKLVELASQIEQYWCLTNTPLN
jgi:CheY-like chemotaxis protein